MAYSSFSGTPQVHSVKLSECPVRAVSVYPDRARVRRSVSVPFTESGKHEIAVSGLGVDVDPKSFKVSNCPVHILETYYAESSSVEVKESPNVDKQRHELDQLNALRHKFLEAGERLEKELALIEQFAKKYTTVEAPGSSGGGGAENTMSREALEAFDAFLELYHRRLEEHDRKRAELKLKIDDIDRRIVGLMDAMDAQYSEKVKVSRVFTIVLGSHSTGQVTLEFSYATSRAWWTPSYDVRINPQQVSIPAMGGAGRIPLHFYGIIEQHTGEDWSDIAVILSTAKKTSGSIPSMAPSVLRVVPSGSGVPPPSSASSGTSGAVASSSSPALYRSDVSGASSFAGATTTHTSGSDSDGADGGASYSGSPSKRRRRKRHHMRTASSKKRKNKGDESSSDGFGSESDGGEAEEPEVDAETLALREAMLNAPGAQFNVQSRISVVHGGRERVLVQPPDALQSQNVYYCIPQLSSSAFLRVHLTNSTQTTFIAGPANVYFGNAFVSSTSLASFAPGESTEVFAGTDPEVQVSYAQNAVAKTPSSKKMVEKHVRKIMIRSLKLMAVRIRIRDQIPVVNDTRIKLRMEKPGKKDTNVAVDLAEGFAQWDLSLGQGSQGAVDLAYSVEYPLDLVVSSQ